MRGVNINKCFYHSSVDKVDPHIPLTPNNTLMRNWKNNCELDLISQHECWKTLALLETFFIAAKRNAVLYSSAHIH